MKKLLGLFLVLLVSVGFVFAGCGDKYADMELVVTNGDEITIFIDDENAVNEANLYDDESSSDTTSSEETDHSQINRVELSVKISGVGDEVSKKVIVSSSDTSKLLVESNTLDGDTSTIILHAMQPGIVKAYIKSVEGNLSKEVTVTIIQKISSISIDSNYTFCVLANGLTYKFDESKIATKPASSNNSSFIYELKEPVEGVSVTENGLITVTEKTADSFDIVIKPQYPSSEEISTTVSVKILDNVDSQEFSLISNVETVIEGDREYLEFIKNDSTNLNTLIIGFETSTLNVDDFVIDIELVDPIAVVDQTRTTNNEVYITGLENGNTILNVAIYFKDFPELVVYTNSLALKIIDIPQTITLGINNTSNSIDVYNKVDTISSYNGTEFVVNVYPDTAQNRQFTIMLNGNEDIFTVRNASNTIFDLSTAVFTSGQKLYIYHDGSIFNETVTMTISSVGNETLTKDINLNLYLNIENIECESSLLLAYDTNSNSYGRTISEDNTNYTALEYTLNPVGANAESLKIVSTDETVVSVYYESEFSAHYLLVNGVGNARLYIYASNRLLKTISVEVVTSFNTFLLSIDSPKDNSSISSRFQEQVYDGGILIGATTTKASMKVSKTIKVYVTQNPYSSKIYSTEYSIQGTTSTSVSIDSYGYLTARNIVSNFKVVVSVKGYIYNNETKKLEVSENPIIREIEFSAIMPIEDIQISATSAEIYASNTVGYANYDQAQKSLSLAITPSNATTNTQDIVWSVNRPDICNLDVQNDGSVIVTGYLPSGSSQETVFVTASITEGDTTMSRECQIIIKRAQQVEQIIISDYDYDAGVSLKLTNLTGDEFISDTYQINATAMPLDALDSELVYFAFDVSKDAYGQYLVDAQGNYVCDYSNPSTLISVNPFGYVTTKENTHGGYAIVYVVARDNITEDGVFNINELTRFEMLLFRVTDGTIENPYEIFTVEDFIDINNALDKNYILASNIDFSTVTNYSPLGNFSGNLSGKRIVNGKEYYHTIQNVNFATLSSNMGLFQNVSGTISDLSITVSNINIDAQLLETLNFGILTAKNTGTILNCSVSLLSNATFNLVNADINNPVSAYIGFIAGENTGIIQNCSVSSNQLASVQLSGDIVGAFGGITALNNGNVVGQFEYAGDSITQSQTEVLFNIDFNMAQSSSSLAINSQITNDKFYVGGVIGYNNVTTKGVEFNGNLTAINNVGGLVGYNNGNISSALSFGKVFGTNNVGGAVGVNAGTMNLVFFETYQDTTQVNGQISSIDSSVQVRNIGGLVGLNTALGSISYSYSTSYSAHKTKVEDNVILASSQNPDLIASNATYVGGFVGLNNGQIKQSYSNLWMQTTNSSNYGVFAGYTNDDLIDCYSIGFIGDASTLITQVKYGTINASNWINVSGMNFDKDMLVLTRNSQNNVETVLLTQAPTKVEVTVKTSDTQNGIFNFGNKRLVLFLNDNNTSYSIYDLITAKISPASARSQNLVVNVVDGSSVAISRSNIIAQNEGYSKIRVASLLDSTVYDEFEVYVIKGIDYIEIQNISSSDISMMIGDTLSLKLANKNNSFINVLAQGGWRFEFSSPNYASLYYFDADLSDENSGIYYVSNNYTQILVAQAKTQGSITIHIAPFSYVQFKNEQNELQDYLFDFVDYSYIDKTIELTIYTGLQGISADKSSAQVMPSENGLLTLTLNTDVEDDFIQAIEISENEITTTYNVDYSSGSYIINHEKLSIEVRNSYFDSVLNKRVITFAFIPSTKIGDFEENNVYNFKFISTSQNGQKTYSSSFVLTVVPQIISSIAINHFADGNAFDETMTNAGEISTDYIYAGEYGVLKINLFPDYSVYSKLILTSTNVENDITSFQQVYLNPDLNNYAERVMESYIVDNGISLMRLSTKNNTGKILYDGNIYVKTLLSSNITIGQTVTLTVSAYNNDNDLVPAFTQDITLTVEKLPYLETNLLEQYTFNNQTAYTQNSFVARNTYFFFNVNYEEGANLSIKLYDENNNSVSASNYSYERVARTLTNNIYSSTYRMKTTGLRLGENYTIEVISTKKQGVETKNSKSLLPFTVVDLLITDFDIYIVDATDTSLEKEIISEKLSKALNKNGWYIAVNIATYYDNTNTSISNSISSMVDKLNGISSDYYSLWYYQTSENSWSSITSGMDYVNFKMTREDENGWLIIGQTTQNVDIIKASINYSYVDGKLTLENSDSTSIQFTQEHSFALDFSLSSSADHPLPIYTLEDFNNMEQGGNYILLNDIIIDEKTDFTPISTAIASLDGNGYSIKLYDTLAITTSGQNGISGLFATVDTNTILKNITIELCANSVVDFSDYTSISFGLLCGVNNGTITNAVVTAKNSDENYLLNIITSLSSETADITAHIGGLVGDNNGQITNSRVYDLRMSGSGDIGGFIGVNNATMASSYSKNVQINSTNGNVGGFVAINGGRILTSYSKGDWENELSSIRADKLMIEATGNVGGFVYQNTGTISDCYANVKMRTQARSAGFVYTNLNNGSISNCISYSDITQNSIAHMPFVGTDGTDIFLNEGSIQNSYFYMNENNDTFIIKDLSGKESGAQYISEVELTSGEYLKSFAFNDYDVSTKEKTEFYGVWVIPTSNYNYFNTQNGFMNYVPELIDANLIAYSRRSILKTEYNENNEPVYYYTYSSDSETTYEIGTRQNPYLIANAQDFINAFVQFEQNGTQKTNLNIYARLIRDISLQDYQDKILTVNVDYTGVFDGNGYTISAISLVSDHNNTQESFGLFKSLKTTSANLQVLERGVIKNLTANFVEVKASQIPVVGGLVGVLDGGVLANIVVVGQNVAVKGSNIVGGVAGLITGKSRIFGINSQISANAGFRNSDISKTGVVYNEDNITDVSYAGAVAGVIDTKIRDTYAQNIKYISAYDISVNGDAKVVANIAGGVFGLVGFNTHIANARFIVSSSQFINGDTVEGGVVGELRGKLEQAYIAHDQTIQTIVDNMNYGVAYERANSTLFKTNSSTYTAGGLVGFNFGGIILDSYAKVDVRNMGANTAGGLVGSTLGGDIKAVYATGSVTAQTNIGGLIGEIVTTKLDAGTYTRLFNYDYLPDFISSDDSLIGIANPTDNDENSMTLSYVISGNNWYNIDRTNNSSKVWGGIIGLFPTSLYQSNPNYINTTHPADSESTEGLINFYVSGANSQIQQFKFGTVGNDINNGQGLNIAKNIGYNELNSSNMSTYFGNWFRFTWNTEQDTKFPSIDLKTIPDTIEVATVSHLLQMIWKMDANYELTSDIDLQNITNWYPIGTEQTPFTGTFTSKIKKTTTVSTARNLNINDYYTIKNMSIIDSYSNYFGLFGVVDSKEVVVFNEESKEYETTYEQAVISNINLTIKNLTSTTINGSNYVGGLVALSKGAIIDNCSVGVSKLANFQTPSIDTNAKFVGGLVGYTTTSSDTSFLSSIQNSSSTININLTAQDSQKTTDCFVGGLVGYLNSGTTIKNSWSNQHIQFYKHNENLPYYNQNYVIGGLVGSHDNGSDNNLGVTVEKCFSLSNITLNEINSNDQNNMIIGGLIGEIYSNIEINYCYTGGQISVQSGSLINQEKLIVGGVIGNIVSISEDSISNNFSITTFDLSIQSNNIGGFVGKGLTDEQKATLSNNNNYYDLALALLDNNDIFAVTSSELISNLMLDTSVWVRLDNSDIGTIVNPLETAQEVKPYYPLIKLGSSSNVYIVLGADKTELNAVDSMIKVGSKFNPIQISEFNSQDNKSNDLVYNLTNNEEEDYKYYIQTQNILCDTNLASNSLPIEKLYGFYNGGGYIIQGATLYGETDKTNIALFGILSENSVISSLHLTEINIDIRSNINDEINVGGLVGVSMPNSTIYAVTVSGKISALPKDNTQVLNIGGIVANATETNISFCASYVDFASFEYKEYYKGVVFNSTNTLVANELNIGSIAGKYSGTTQKRYNISNVYAFGEIDYTNAQQSTNIGSLIGKASNVTLINYYALTNLSTKQYQINDSSQFVASRNNVTLTDTQISTNLSNDSDFATNYGYATFDEILVGVPVTIYQSIDNINYYYVANSKQLDYLLNNKTSENDYYNIMLIKDIVATNNFTAITYGGIIDGGGYTMYNMSSPLAQEFVGIIKNFGVKAQNNGTNYLFNQILNAQVSNVNAGEFVLAQSQDLVSKSYSLFSDESTYNDDSDKNMWLDLGNGNVLRDFTQYWAEIDLRCVYDDSIAQIDNLNEVVYTVISDKYQLAKMLYSDIYSNSEYTLGKNYYIYMTAQDNFDMSGKIWSGLGNNSQHGFSANITYDYDILSQKFGSNLIAPIFKNLYIEGTRNVGFVSNSTENLKLSNISFENVKLSYYDNQGSDVQVANFGTVVGYASDASISNVKVFGEIDISLPESCYVGGAFGFIRGSLNNIIVESASTIRGLDAVGGIAGFFEYSNLSSGKVSVAQNFTNKTSIIARDYVGGLFGQIIGTTSEILGTTPSSSINESSISNNNAMISGRNFVGGIAGYSNGYLDSFKNVGNVVSNGYAVGGLIGYNNGSISKSRNYATIQTGVVSTNTPSTQNKENTVMLEIALDSSTFNNNAIKNGYFFGGIVGLNNGDIIECKNGSSSSSDYVTATSFVGGIAGYNQGKIFTSKGIDLDGETSIIDANENHNTVSGESFVGGIVGYNGVIGSISSAILDFYTTNTQKNLYAKIYLGGIAGYNAGFIINTLAREVSISGNLIQNLGGIVGYNDVSGVIERSNASVSLQVNYDNSYSTSNVITLNNQDFGTMYFGGISGINKGSIERSMFTNGTLTNSQNFNANVYFGGVTGLNVGTIYESIVSSSATIICQYNAQESAYYNKVGGLVGQNNNNAIITNSYSLASISKFGSYEKIMVGGLCGENNGTITNCYCNANTANAIIYLNNGSISDSYYIIVSNDTEYALPSDSENDENFYKFMTTNFNIENCVVVPSYSIPNNYFLIQTDEENNLFAVVNQLQYSLISTNGVWASMQDKSTISFSQPILLPQYHNSKQWFEKVNIDGADYFKLIDDIEISFDELRQYIENIDEFKQTIYKQSFVHMLNWTGAYMPTVSTISTITTNYDQAQNLMTLSFNGEGTEQNPYQLSTMSDFSTLKYHLEQGITFHGNYFIMTNDIYFNDSFLGLGTEVTPFDGIIDGNGKSLSKIKMNSGEVTNLNDIGIFRVLGENAVISNLTISNSSFVGNENVGALAGINKGTLNNISVVGNTADNYVTGHKNVGGIVGLNYGLITNSISIISVFGIDDNAQNIGGIAGYNGSYSISNSQINGLIELCETSDYFVNNQLAYENVIGFKDITTNSRHLLNVGGIVGYNIGRISQCANNVNIKANTVEVVTEKGGVGGIVGTNKSGSIVNSINYGALLIYGSMPLGGIVGYLESGSLNAVISVGTINVSNKCGDIYGERTSGRATNLVSLNTILQTTNATIVGTRLTNNQFLDTANRFTNFSGFDMVNSNSIWGIVATTGIEDNSYKPYANSLQEYRYPRLTKLLSSSGLNFSYAVFNGAGTENNPYLIESNKQMRLFGQIINVDSEDAISSLPNHKINGVNYFTATFKSEIELQQQYNQLKYYKIDTSVVDATNNRAKLTQLDLGNWVSLKSIECKFDGNGYTLKLGTITQTKINNVAVSLDSRNNYAVGFIASVRDFAYIKNINLNIDTLQVSTKNDEMVYAGGFVGYVYNSNLNIDNQNFYNNITVSISKISYNENIYNYVKGTSYKYIYTPTNQAISELEISDQGILSETSNVAWGQLIGYRH